MKKLREMWEWIIAAAAALLGLILYGWLREREGRKKAKAALKAKKADAERKRAERIREKAEGREDVALEAAEKLEEKRRKRMEEAARELGKRREDIKGMSDEELADTLGGLLAGSGGTDGA